MSAREITNTIYLRRKNKIILDSSTSQLDEAYIEALLQNLQSLGFTLCDEIIEILKTFSIAEVGQFHTDFTNSLKEMLGANVQYKPMYPNFPQQVAQATDRELSVNALAHYFGDLIGARILPAYKKKRRTALQDETKLKTINLGSTEDFNLIFIRLMKAKTSISETDKKDIEWFIQKHQNEVLKFLPEEIPLKENRAIIGACLVKYTEIAEPFLRTQLKTATDVLRLVVALSEGDVSLATKTKFQNIKRKDRRLILSLLENCQFITEDILRYKEFWKRLGERLHPFEYKEIYPKCFEAFDVIRNDKTFETFNSKIETALLKKDLDFILNLLQSRPGELARKLDNLLRLSPDAEKVIAIFSQVSEKVSSSVLLQVWTHFKHRNQPKDLRVFFPKGNVSKVQAITNNLPKIDEVIRQKMVAVCESALIAKYEKLERLGKVYLDKNLKKYTVPFSLRSASKSLKTVGKGSKLDFPAGNTLRFFIWWKDGEKRTDIDLSAVALSNKYAFKTTVAFFNLRELGGYHSGDITSAPDGASEFIDIAIDQFLNSGIRYVVMCVNSFTQQPFCNLPECFAGFMIRQQPNSGEIYDPRTVENKFDLTSDTKMAIPLIIDLEVRKVIWTDLALKNHPGFSNNVFDNLSSISLITKAMTELVKPSLYDLFQLHIKARGEKVEKKAEADIIFSEKEGVTPLHTEQIIAEYL